MTKFSKTIKVRLILEQNGEILLLQQTNQNGGKYTLIGGTVEAEEFPIDALIRESHEEAGITLFRENLRLVHTLFKRKSADLRIVIYFKATTWKGRITSKEPEKFEKVSWHPIDELPDSTSPTVQHILRQYLKGNMYSEFSKK
ncbi:MAG: NUDIX hydrolase [Bacteroidota bacterium]